MKTLVFLLISLLCLSGCGVEWFPDNTSTSPTQSSVSITTTTLPDATAGSAFSQDLAATGTAPLTFTVSGGSLPAGLTLSPSGTISGTPTTAGTSNFTVMVTDSSNPALTSTQSFTMVVA